MSTVTTRSASRRSRSGATSRCPPGSVRSDSGSSVGAAKPTGDVLTGAGRHLGQGQARPDGVGVREDVAHHDDRVGGREQFRRAVRSRRAAQVTSV